MAEQSRRPFEGKDLMEAKGKGTLKALAKARALSLKAKALRWQGQRPFEAKGKGTLKAKALRWKKHGHFEGKRTLEGKR
jgi:hypothetical protein